MEPRSPALGVWSQPRGRQGVPIIRFVVVAFVPNLSDFATLWTVAHQASLSMGFSRQSLPSPAMDPASAALAGGFFPAEPAGNHALLET